MIDVLCEFLFDVTSNPFELLFIIEWFLHGTQTFLSMSSETLSKNCISSWLLTV